MRPEDVAWAFARAKARGTKLRYGLCWAEPPYDGEGIPLAQCVTLARTEVIAINITHISLN